MSQPSATIENKPLLGKTVVVTRAQRQAGSLINRLEELGANALEFPVIKIVPPESFEPVDSAISRLNSFDWIVFTSVNGVEYFWPRLQMAGKSAADLKSLKVCAIGPATAAALTGRGVTPALVPQKFVAEGILEDLGDVAGQRFLLPRAELAREALLDGLEARGATVEQLIAYRTVVADTGGNLDTAELLNLLEAGRVDLVTFTSSSTVRFFAARLAVVTAKPMPTLLSKTLVACIGPVTAGTAREIGLTVGLEAPEFTIDHLVKAILDFYESKE